MTALFCRYLSILLCGLSLAACDDALTGPVAPSLTTAPSSGDLVLDSFESSKLTGWSSYVQRGSKLTLKTTALGASGSYAMSVTYSVKSTALAQRDFSAPQDWREFDFIEFQVYGNATGNTIWLEIKDNGPSTTSAELFLYRFSDDFSGWKAFRVSWDQFTRRQDWQPSGAPDDGFDRTAVRGLRFAPQAGSGTFYVDDIRLVRGTLEATPTPEPTPAPSPDPVPAVACAVDGALRVVEVATASELSSALAGAAPGDLIRLADGIYTGRFSTSVSGTEKQRVRLCGSRAAKLRTGSVRDQGYALTLKGSYWTLEGFTVTDAQQGVRVFGGSHNLLTSLAVHGIGQEAVKFHGFSHYNTLQKSQIWNTGLYKAEYGEGVYLGTYRGHWDIYTGGQPDTSSYNRVLDNSFGPDVRSEHIDAKEGSMRGLISGNTFNGAGQVQSQSWVDSWVEITGSGYKVSNNRGARAIRDGFQVTVGDSRWGHDNTFVDNVADVGTSGVGFRVASNATGTVISCQNTVVNAGGGLSNVACR